MDEERDDISIESEGDAGGAMSEEDIAAQEDRADGKLAKLRKELEECRKEKQEYLDGWQRTKADYVNALRRFEEDTKSAELKGKRKAAEALLPALDALTRARGAGALPDGFKAIAKQLESAFGNLGLVPVGQEGEAFDPSMHEAIGQDATDDPKQDGVVTVVLEQGWKLGDHLVRPARVRVAQYAD